LLSSIPISLFQVKPSKPVILGKKTRPELDSRSAIQVVTNVYPVTTASIPVFRYDMLIIASYPRARGGDDAKVELTKKSTGGGE